MQLTQSFGGGPCIQWDQLLMAGGAEAVAMMVNASTWLNATYEQGWTNAGTALFITKNSQIGSFAWDYSAAYLVAWGGAHVLLVGGLALAACVVACPVAITTIQTLFGLGTTGAIVCAEDTECADAVGNEATQAVEQGVTVLGKFNSNQILAESLTPPGNWLNIPMAEWNAMEEGERWAINQQWLDDAIARGDSFRLSTLPISQNLTGGFGDEINYMCDILGWIVNATGDGLTPPSCQ
ncbi:MAG: hypothetical protein WBW94_06275 [Anaerolineales bacterium]